MLAYLPFPGYSHVADDSVSGSDPVENVPREQHSVRFFGDIVGYIVESGCRPGCSSEQLIMPPSMEGPYEHPMIEDAELQTWVGRINYLDGGAENAAGGMFKESDIARISHMQSGLYT